MRIEKVMTTDVDYVEVPGVRAGLLEKMKTTGHNGFPVVKKGSKKVVGFISRSNLLKNPNETQLALIMNPNPISLTPFQTIDVAAEKMRELGIRRFPIVKKDKLVGIISVSDLITKAIAKSTISGNIGPFVKKRATTVWDQTPIRVAHHIMRIANKQILPAINDSGTLTGIVSDSELLQHAKIVREEKKSDTSIGSEGDKWAWDASGTLYITKNKLTFPEKLTVKDIMVTKIVTVNEETPIPDCAKKMSELDLDQLPVLDAHGTISGVIIDTDLIQVLIKKD
ncbi:MAG: CBS domain-containing protein [Candidatus Ranarchaeia archaeon]